MPGRNRSSDTRQARSRKEPVPPAVPTVEHEAMEAGQAEAFAPGTGEAGKILTELTKDTIISGIIFSEILGRPRCKRKGRW